MHEIVGFREGISHGLFAPRSVDQRASGLGGITISPSLMGLNVVRFIPMGAVRCLRIASSNDRPVTLRTTYPSSAKAILEYAGFECKGNIA